MKDEHNRKNFAFVVAAVREEWPDSFKHRIAVHLELSKSYSIELDVAANNVEDLVITFQADLLNRFEPKEAIEKYDTSQIKSQLIYHLSMSSTPLYFYCSPKKEIIEKLEYLQAIVQCWESLELTDSQNKHVLLIVYGTKGKGFFNLGEKKVEKWRKALLEKLTSLVVVPPLKSVDKEYVFNWSGDELDDNPVIKTKFEQAVAKIKGNSIPYLTLKETFVEIANSQNQERKIP